MISWWEVLKASKGLPVNNYYAQMWGKQLGAAGYVIAELTAPLPLTINTDGTVLLDYRIYGNTLETTIKTANLVPLTTQKTATADGITVTIDSNGVWHVTGTATSNATILFDLEEAFTVPVALDYGGEGVIQLFNSVAMGDGGNGTARVLFYYGSVQRDYMGLHIQNRSITQYSDLANKGINRLGIWVKQGVTCDFTLSPMVVDDGIVHNEYILPEITEAQDVGVRTENLWNDDWFDKNVSDDSLKYVHIYVGEGAFTCFTTCPRIPGQYDTTASRFIFFLSGRVNGGAQNAANGVWNGTPRTVTSSDGYVTLGYRKIEMYDVRPWEYETMIVEGSTAPTSYIPYGYKLPMISRTENLFDYSSTETGYRIQWASGRPYADATAIMSDYIPVKEGDYVLNTGVVVIGYAADKSYVGVYRSDKTWKKQSSEVFLAFTVLSSSNVKFVKLLTYGDYGLITNTLMLTEGSTAPDSYIPYYREEIPIYIGDTKLAKDEYVSYGEQKVYKRTSNLFTPSDDKGYYQGNQFVADDDYLCTPYIPLDDPEYWVKMDFDTTNAPIGGKYGVEWFANYNTPVYGECIDIRFHSGWIYDGRYEVDPEVVVVHTPKYVRAFMHKDCTNINLNIGSDREHSEYAPYLTPQDPPVPLPALPTTEGETTFEYAGGEPQPEQMYVKYRRKD